MKRIVLLLLIAIPLFSLAQEKVIWDYPVKPGSEEWLNIEDYSKRLELLNVPDKVLPKLNTEELVKICFNYPQMELIFTRNDILSGISYVSTLFNGLTELSKRNDAGIKLLQFYKEFKPSKYSSADKEGKIKHKKDFIIIELLLASPIVLENMNKIERTNLLNVSYNMYEEKAKYWDKFYFEQISPNLLIMAQILKIDNPTMQIKNEFNKDMDILLSTGKTINPEFVSKIINEVNNYLE